MVIILGYHANHHSLSTGVMNEMSNKKANPKDVYKIALSFLRERNQLEREIEYLHNLEDGFYSVTPTVCRLAYDRLEAINAHIEEVLCFYNPVIVAYAVETL